MPETALDSIALRVFCIEVIRIASAKPGATRSMTFSVASGVTSRAASPVPPVVRIKSA
ncbi:hypothetical protein D3C87_2201480 [compost metagenome]